MNSTDNTVALVDGTIVTTDSPEWQKECLHWHEHVSNMRHRSVEQRRGYLDGVRITEGDEACKRLKAAYSADWQRRKDELAAPNEGAA